ncbi:hypothetical protein SAMN03080594_11084 [Arenibacter palladensis]|uniref:Uncharacterized protein n=1 Tax=Arenibacter palladensis TaxID=237373 RepID=A0A1M5G2S5_9FLAO|nr:hypothetical protein [Arenibacter palladensis]SHF98110.1 hypothetical protein SAMN03080594_11084 [Arenibacter palladensis]
MLLRRTNIREKLILAKQKDKSADKILNDVYRLLAKEDDAQKRIEDNLKSMDAVISNDFNFDLLETAEIYHVRHIKKIAVDYRLRFLDSHYFKGEIPQDAISKIKKLEKEHELEIKGFKILAPSKLFKLKDRDDPILFAPIGNDYYYLIHKWGRDLHPLRKILMWPFKSLVNLVALVVGISYVITLLVPNGLFSKESSSFQFWVIFFFMFKCLASIVIFYGFALGKNFNPAIWNCKYLKT